ncbi:MAG: PAS domain S-box protein [Nitrospira sp.]|nr:PAS domain S-box protein [Nitrospira sp.]
MSPTSHLRELDLLRKQVADLRRELTERDQTVYERKRQFDDELTDLYERSDMLRAIVTGIAADTGEDFFPGLVCHLSSVLGVQYAVIGEVLQGPIRKIRTIAVSAGGGLVDNFEYPLMNTPCETALGQSYACYERDVRTVFPLFERLAQLGVEGYCGIPLRAKGGAIIGLLVVMDTKPLRNTERLKSLMTVFASRAGAELQRRQTETKLHQQQHRLVEAQARAHLGSWDWDIESGSVQWSDEQFRIFGYEPGSIAATYETFMMSLHQQDRDRVLNAIDSALTGGTIYDVDCRIVRPSGEIRAIHARGEVTRDTTGRPVSLSSSVLDITDRKLVEEELRISQDQLQRALRASSTGLWSWNTGTNEVVFSEEWKRQLGYEQTEISDSFETWVKLLHPDDRVGAVAYAQGYVTAPEGDYRQVFRLQHKDGTYRWIEARASFVREADGRMTHLLGSHTDITDRSHMEETIRESEERYRTLVELSPSGVFVFCEGRTVYVNRTGALLMGARDPQEILDRPTFEFIHPDYHQEVRDSVTRLLKGGVSVHSAERVYVRLDGTTIPVQVEAGRIMWNGKPAILGMFSDITERKQSERASLEHRHAIRALHDISSVQGRSLNERVEALLQLGCRFFNMPIGMRTFIRGDELEVGHVNAPGTAFHQGMCVPLSKTYCSETLQQRGPVCFEHAGASPEWQQHPAYAALKLEAYLGTVICGVEHTYGTLCFASDKPRSKPFTDSERDFIQLMARWLGGELDRQAALDSLRQSEARYRTLYDETPSMYFTIDRTGIVRSVNQFGAQYLGYCVEDLVGKSVSAIFLEADRARASAEIDACFHQPEGVAQWELRKVRSDGAVLWVREHVRVLQSRDGEPVALIVCEDITERKRTEDALADLNATLERQVIDRTEALRRSEERFRQFFDHAPNVTCLKNNDGRYLYTNRRFDEVFGIAPGMALGRTDDELFPQEQAAQFRSHDREVLASGCGREFEEVTQQRDGLRVSIVVKFPVADAAGSLSAIGVIATDVTERNRTQEALRESEARWQQFAESVGSAFWIADVAPDERKVLYVNTAFTFIWGIERDEIYRNWSLWLESIHPDDHLRVKASHDRFIGGGAAAVFHCEYRIVGRDGHIRWISDRRVRMPGWEHRIAGIAEDITHHKQQLSLMAQTETIGKIGGWQLDFLTNRLWWSDETYRLHETSSELYSPTVETALNFYTPESRPLIAEALRNGESQGTPWDLELDLITAMGRRVAVRAVGKVDVVNGRAVRAYGTFQDVTERKRAAEALRLAHDELERKVMERTAELQESEDRYARATAIGKVGVWELDVLNGQYHGDTNLKALFGYGTDELSTDPFVWLRLVHPDDQPIAMRNWELVQSGAAETAHYELRHVKRDGSIVWGDVRARAVRDPKGQLTHLIGATVDITGRKRAETILALENGILEGVAAGVPLDDLLNQLAGGIEAIAQGCCCSILLLDEDGQHLRHGAAPSLPDSYTAAIDGIPIGPSAGSCGTAAYRNMPIVAKDIATDPLWAGYKELALRHNLRACWSMPIASSIGGVLGTFAIYYRIPRDPTNEERRLIEQAVRLAQIAIERKLAEQALKASEEKLRQSLLASNTGLWEWNTETNEVWLSREWKAQLGYEETELPDTFESWESRLHPDDRARAIAYAMRYRDHPVGAFRQDFRLLHKDGQYRWIDSHASFVAEPDGRLVRLLGSHTDITERKESEHTLSESEARFRTLVANIPGAIYRCAVDREWTMSYLSDAIEAIVGYPAKHFVANRTRSYASVIHPDDRRLVEEVTWTSLKKHSPYVIEYRLIHASGAVRWVYEKGQGVFTPDGQVRFLDGAIFDITERKQAEQALRISEERFAKAFQASPHPVVISELDSGLVVDANEAAWQLFGYRKEEVVGQTTLQIGLWQSADERTQYLERLKGEGSIRNAEVQLRSRNGDVRQCLLSAELIELNGKQCVVTVGDDVTERKRMERALRRTQFSVDKAVEAVLWVDPTGRIFDVNETACRMFGYSPQEMTTMTVHDIDPNFPVERWSEHWIHLKEQGALAFEAKYWSRTGMVYEAEVTFNYLQYDGKEYGCAILRDIGERKRAEAELHRSHAFLRQVIDTDPNFIFAKDRDGRFTMANRAVADYYGTTVEDLIGKSDADFNGDQDEVEFFRQKDCEVMESLEECFVPEEKITDSTGKTRWLQTVKRPILDDQGRAHMVLGAATDITERKRMEEILLQHERDLHAALQERERISEDLHDGILQSLYAVGLGLETCKPMIKQQPRHVSVQCMATLDQAIDQLNHVMGEVRNFIAGLESQVMQGGDFPTVLRTMVTAMAGSSSAKCTIRIHKGAARQLSTEQALHLINIVREGLSNALRHSDAKRITVSLCSLRRCVRLAIRDDGAGFNASLTQGVGHGLGNMAARAKKVRGQFTLHSKPNEGTRIVLDLPKDTTYAHD